jgi:hypothetical protein
LFTGEPSEMVTVGVSINGFDVEVECFSSVGSINDGVNALFLHDGSFFLVDEVRIVA